VEAGTELLALLDSFDHDDGDLDLYLVGNDEEIIATSAGATDEEFVSWCAPERDEVTLAVIGYAGAQNDYRLSISVEAAACCVDDGFEPDDTLSDPRVVESGDAVDGTICPDDDDYIAFEVTGDAFVSFLLIFESDSIDLDVELYDEEGRVIATAATTGDEELEALIDAPGIYTLRIFGFLGDSGEYLGELTVESL
jgi:hypothetical protein